MTDDQMTETETTAPALRTRERDPLFEAVCAATGTDPARLTPRSRGVINGALRDLRAAGATPDEVPTAAAIWRLRYPDAQLTAPALAKHWPTLHTLPPPRMTRGSPAIVGAVARMEGRQ